MRTRTTYVALLLALAAGGALTIVSCTADTMSPNSVAPNPQVAQARLDDLRQKYSWIGKYHTDGLAYIYTELSKNDGKPQTQADMCRRAVKAVKEFHKATRNAEVPASFLSESFRNEACLSESELAPTRKSILVSLPGMSTRYDLSSAAVTYMDRIGAVADNASSLYDFVSQVNTIEAQAVGSLPESEASAVAAVASVARSSASYWEQNFTSWTGISSTQPTQYSRSVVDFNGQPLLNRMPGWWDHPATKGFRKVLGADAISAARTAYLAWAVGPVAPEAVAASALFASGTTAIALLLF